MQKCSRYANDFKKSLEVIQHTCINAPSYNTDFHTEPRSFNMGVLMKPAFVKLENIAYVLNKQPADMQNFEMRQLEFDNIIVLCKNVNLREGVRSTHKSSTFVRRLFVES